MEIDFELAKCGKNAPCAVGTGGGFFPEKFLKKKSWLTQLGRVVDGEGHVLQRRGASGKHVFAFPNLDFEKRQRHIFLKSKNDGTALAAAERRTQVVAMLVFGAAVCVGGKGNLGWHFRVLVLAVAAWEAGQGKEVQAEYLTE